MYAQFGQPFIKKFNIIHITPPCVYSITPCILNFIEIKDINLHLTHFPKNHKKDKLNLFGHNHRATGHWKSYGINIGCDLNHFMLYSESDIIKLLKHKSNYWDKDENVTDIHK